MLQIQLGDRQVVGQASLLTGGTLLNNSTATLRAAIDRTIPRDINARNLGVEKLGMVRIYRFNYRWCQKRSIFFLPMKPHS